MLIAAIVGGVAKFAATMISIASYITGAIASAVNGWISAIKGLISTIQDMVPDWIQRLLGGGTVDLNVTASQYRAPIASMADKYTGGKDPLGNGAIVNSNQTSIFNVSSPDEAARINRVISENGAKNAARSARSGVKQ